MSIIYPLTFPTTKGLGRFKMSARSVVSMARSPFTGHQDIQVFQGQWWEVDASFPPLDSEDFDIIVSFFLSLNGREGTFLLGDPSKATPRGTASSSPGTPVINGGSQTGDSLNGTGAPASATGYLKAGDYIQIGSGSAAKLHRVLEDTDTDGSGNFTVTIWPCLRSSPTNGNPIVVSNTVGLWRLEANSVDWDVVPVVPYNLSFKAIEAL